MITAGTGYTVGNASAKAATRKAFKKSVNKFVREVAKDGTAPVIILISKKAVKHNGKSKITTETRALTENALASYLDGKIISGASQAAQQVGAKPCTKHASRGDDGKCRCQNGYTIKNGECVTKMKVPQYKVRG
ncbi:hypothetical protein A2232_02920 [candidate division WOR-1 bacterium RIFOXYA2_FULL_46_56]|nr:MAG: hypothetical protein A2232_02920 [candidate division WOR-1 bacterium RIFOXYA2_FULL_46_56]